MKYQIAVVKGDGIGPEIVSEAMLVLEKIGESSVMNFPSRKCWLAAARLMQTAFR